MFFIYDFDGIELKSGENLFVIKTYCQLLWWGYLYSYFALVLCILVQASITSKFKCKCVNKNF